MLQQPNLESVLNNVNQFINIDVHRQRYAEHFSNLRDTIFKHLRKNDVFAYIFNGFQLGGSYGDNVKVSIPNEFDLVFHITFPEQPLIIVIKDEDVPGNVFLDFTNVLKKIAKEKQHENNLKHLQLWLDKNNFLIIEKFQLFIQSQFINVLLEMQNQITFDGKISKLRYKRQGPAHSIYVRGSLDFDYSVDFVPGILLSENQRVIPHIKGQWEAIPKPSKNSHHTNTSFRGSYYQQEHNIIRGKMQLKNVYRMLKKFRDTKTNMNKMKSYYIKTLFLYKASQQNSKYWTKSLTEIIIDMFKDLEMSLRKENLPFFWDQKLNLYQYYSPNLIREMLGCVESSRKILEKAASQLTLPVQNRVYCIFLDTDERNLLKNQCSVVCPLDNRNPADVTSNSVEKCVTKEFSARQAIADLSTEQPKNSTCVIC